MRSSLKALANAIALVVASPAALTCWLERHLSPKSEAVFEFWANCVALLPGRPGMYVRRAFYHMTLESCSLDCYIGFGAIFTHRKVQVEDGVYVGPYALIGSSRLRKSCLLGSRVSVLSGPALHEMDQDGSWKATDLSRLRQVDIGENVWIGEGGVVMVDVGAGSMVGTGAVVSTRVRSHVVVAGNPARFVRRLRSDSGNVADGSGKEPDREQGVPPLH